MEILLLCIVTLTLGAVGATRRSSMATREENTFDDGFDGWSLPEKSWQRIQMKRIIDSHHDEIKLDADDSTRDENNYVLVPYANKKDDKLSSIISTMTRDLSISEGGELEIMFSILIVGWNTSLLDKPEENRLQNPRLQVFYDEDVVFDVSSAVSQHRDHYSFGRWNQFKMLSTYREELNLTVTIIGSNGKDTENAIVILDNIFITTRQPEDEEQDNTELPFENPRLEPEADLNENGTWKKVETEANDEAEDEEHDAERGRPKFCDLLPEIGPCKFNRKRYFFNAKNGKCEIFFFGGCLGNENNFEDAEACELLCADRQIVEPLESEVRKVEFTTFEEGFDGWSQRSWSKIQYDSNFASGLDIVCPPPLRGQSLTNEFGVIPEYHMFDFRQPELTQEFEVENNSTLIMEFQLLVKGVTSSGFLSFFLHLDPGFVIYVGNIKVFDFKVHGINDKNWHRYRLTMNQSEVEEHRRETGDKFLIITIKGWLGSGRKGMIVLDNVNVTQVHNNTGGSSTDVSSTTANVLTNISSTIPFIDDSQEETTVAVSTVLPESDECLLESDIGDCKGSFTRFYFEKDTKECNEFNWTGCGGNVNRYLSVKECLSQCKPEESDDYDEQHSLAPTDPQLVCSLPAKPGRCRATFKRFYFSPQSGMCESFIYGGCDLNSNNFRSEEECRTFCEPVMTDEIKEEYKSEDQTIRPDIWLPGRKFTECHHPCMEPPACTTPAHLPIFLAKMYYFDPKDSACKTYQYRGCPGKGNCFSTMLECDLLCVGPEVTPPPTTLPATSAITTTPPSVYNESQCALPPDKGPCTPLFGTEQIKRFYYSTALEKCLEFHWGGCGGNANNFQTREECESVCQPEEEDLPIHYGLNKTNLDITKHKEDSDELNTKEDSDEHITNENSDEPDNSPKTVCSLVSAVGACTPIESSQYKTRYFYKRDTDACETFWYSGCGGNHNNFKNKADCESFCGVKSKNESGPDVNVLINGKGVHLDEFNKSNCNIKHKRGECRANFPRWFFSFLDNTCLKFNYSGCKGNDNNFFSKSTCLKFCPPMETTGNETRCEKVRARGYCNGGERLNRFYFDTYTNMCRLFRGCEDVGSDKNNFVSYNDCANTCSKATLMKSLKLNDDITAEPVSQSSSKSVAAATVEAILALIIIGLTMAAAVLGYKHYKVRESAERYRLFPPSRSGSVAVVPQEGGAPVAEYENPAYNNDLYNPPDLETNNEMTLTLGDIGNKSSRLTSSDT